MSYQHIAVPTAGEKITMENGRLNVPDHPILAYIEGDGIGVDITPAALTVPAGASVSLTFRNSGVQEHDLALVPADTDLFNVDSAAVLNDIQTGPVAPGQSFRLGFIAPAADTYRYVCLIPGHAAAGMVGTLTVTGE